VVAWIRRVLKIKRVGHAGTLDPLATGVLLVCVGQATRVSEYVMASDKVYRAQIQLGTTTDTYDLDGEVVATHPLPPGLDEAGLETALGGFVGDIMQAPPAYSAIKQDGVALHRRMRRGKIN
jgi:tRNA pseudouridine55 synthase